MLQTIVSLLGTALIGVIAWTVQLGNRVSVTETRQQDLPALLDAKFDPINVRLARIERSLNGHLKG